MGRTETPSANRIKHAINNWITSNPEEHLMEIVVDFTSADYAWGDGPLTGLLPF
jgi:hypothetical protein